VVIRYVRVAVRVDVIPGRTVLRLGKSESYPATVGMSYSASTVSQGDCWALAEVSE